MTVEELWEEQRMNRKVDDTLVPVPVGVLAQLKAMSAFSNYKTMNVKEVWNDIDRRCEEVEKGLSDFIDVMTTAYSIFEIENNEGPEEARKLIDEMIVKMPHEEADGFMIFVAMELRRLRAEYEEESK